MFGTGYLADLGKVGSGELVGGSHINLSSGVFENALNIGRFAKLDTGSIDNMDGSGAPVVTGVVLRSAANKLESGGTLDNTIYNTVNTCRHGLVTVDVKAGQTPTRYGQVYACNAGDANDGKAATSNAGGSVLAGAIFIDKVDTDVWLVLMLAQPPVSVVNEQFYTPAQYTVATAPNVVTYNGQVFLFTDGAAGEPVLAYSDGVHWLKLDGTGAQIVGA